MAELIDDVLELLAPWPTANSLASMLRFESANEASTSAQLAVPLLVTGMVEQLKDPEVAGGLLELLPAVDVGGLRDLETTFNESLYEPIGSEALNQVLSGRHRRAGDAVAEEVGCDKASAYGVFPPMAWLVLGVIADRHGTDHSRHTLLNVVEQEQSALLKTGWGEWMSVVALDVGSEAPPSTSSQVLRSDAESEAQTVAATAASYPPPVSRESRPAVPEPAPAVRQTAAQVERSPGAVRTRSAEDGEIEKVQTLSRPEDSGRRVLLVLGALLVLGLSGALIWYVSSRDDQTAIGNPETPGGTEGVAGDEDGSTTTNGAEGVAPVVVALSDKTGASPDLMAMASLRFDVDGGQVCYEIDAVGFDDGFAGQISQGEEGVQGRMVVDLGPLTESSAGCAVADPLRIKAAIDDPVGHYLLLVTPDRTASISGRLAGSDLEDDPADGLVYDPDGGGAFIIIDDGGFILEGQVPDAETADLLLAEFDDTGIDASDIENRLEVAAGAPNPSGRIVLQNDLLFDVGSAELAAQESASLSQVALLFVARPDWQISVLGHTDDSGNPISNLALSQERAEAVRNELISLGVSDFALDATGVGDTDPVADNGTPEGREQNRRIEFQVQPRSG